MASVLHGITKRRSVGECSARYSFVIAGLLAVSTSAIAQTSPDRTSHCTATPATAPAPAPQGKAGRTGAPLRAPANSVKVTPGALQEAVNTHGENTSFLLLPGTYTDAAVKLKNGDHFYGQGKATWDGGGKQEMAIIASGAHRIVVSGIKFFHFNPPHHGRGIFNLNQDETDFTIEGCEIAYNSGGTPVMVGNTSYIINNSIHDNYDTGIAGYILSRTVINHNEIYDNYLKKINPDTRTGEAAGIKLVKTSNVSVINNYIHSNYGVGVWFDSDNEYSLIEGNVITGNTHRGIMDEISYSATISNNTITSNGKLSGWIGGAGVFIATAANVEVCNNIVNDNFQGITGFQNERGTGEHGKYATTNAKIHDNYITMRQGVTGLTLGAEKDPTNQFYDNHYCLASGAEFIWGTKTDLKGWQAAGQDKNGTFKCGF